MSDINKPIDSRMVVDTRQDLILLSNWQNKDGNVIAYQGMIVSVINDSETINNDAYILKQLPVTNESNWSKIGSAGTTNYDALDNRPSINGNVLTGNKTTEDLGIIIPDVSTLATKTEVSTKQDKLVSGTNIKTINGSTILGEGNIVIEGGTNLPVNDKYSVLHNGEFIDLFERKGGTALVEYNSTEYKEQNSTSNSNPLSSPFSIVNPLVSYRNSYLKSISFKPSSSTFKTAIGYIDNGLDYGAFTNWYFDIMAKAEDIGVLTEFMLDGTDDRVTINTDFLDAEKGMIKTFDKEGVYLSVGSPDGASFYYGGSPSGTVSGTTFKTRTGGGALLDTNLGMYLKIAKEEEIEEGYVIPELEEINNDTKSKVSFTEVQTLTEEQKTLAKQNIGISSTSDYNPLKGKKISFLGDSITTYSGWIPAGNATFYPNQDVQDVNDTYWKKLIDNLELELVVNNSWSGSVITRGGTGSVIDQGRYEELHTADKEPDIIFINIGTNDFRKNADLGEYNGMSTTPTIDECYSFREAYAFVLAEISKRYPTAQIWCSSLATQDSVGSTSGYPEINGNGVVIHEYNNVIRELATAYGAKIIELASCGITNFNVTTYMGDKLHPNKAGMDLYYNQAKGQLISNATSAIKIGGTEGNTEIVQTTGTSTTAVMSQKGSTDNFLAKKINSDYSVIHKGELLDISTKITNIVRESANGYPTTTNTSIPSVAPFYLTNGQDIQGKYILDFTYIPKNNLPLVVGALNVSTYEEAVPLGIGIRTFTEKLFTINPLPAEMDIATTYKLDGTDSRVVINEDVTENNKVKLKEGYTIGLEEYSASGEGCFGYTSYGAGNDVNSFYRYSAGAVSKDGLNELCIGFTLSDGSQIGYQVPVLEEFDNRISELEDTSLKFTPQTLTTEEQVQVKTNLNIIDTVVEQGVGESTTNTISQAALTGLLNNKVEVETGKGLSANDYTTEDKDKLALLYNYDDTEVKAEIATLETDKADKATTYTKEEIDAQRSGVYRFMGSVPTYADLPNTGNTNGDVYNTSDTDANFAWDGTEWDGLGSTIDLTAYALKTYVDDIKAELLALINTKLDKDTIKVLSNTSEYDALTPEEKLETIAFIEEV